jgi:hypothetical protein
VAYDFSTKKKNNNNDDDKNYININGNTLTYRIIPNKQISISR